MKRHFAPSLFALSLCALLGGVRTAGAQGAEAVVPPPIDSVATFKSATQKAAPVKVDLERASSAHAPLIQPGSAVRLSDLGVIADAATARDFAAIQGRDWKMPTSRTLMIGGVAAVAIGLIAVKGDAGAIIAMAGGGVAVYGLYLHYNR